MAVKPKCIICNKDLEGGYQRIIYSEIDVSDIPQEQKDELKKKPEQISYWAHDPNDLHRDIEVFAHLECFLKVKQQFKDFDQPIQDYDTFKYPIIENDKIVLKTPKEFLKSLDKLF